MDPVTGAAAILAATQLLGSVMGTKAAKEQQAKNLQFQLAQQSTGLEQAGIQQATSGQIGALGNLVEAYRSALVGK